MKVVVYIFLATSVVAIRQDNSEEQLISYLRDLGVLPSSHINTLIPAARPERTVSTSRPFYYDDRECPRGTVRNVDGSCVEPIIERRVFFYSLPTKRITRPRAPSPPPPRSQNVDYELILMNYQDETENEVHRPTASSIDLPQNAFTRVPSRHIYNPYGYYNLNQPHFILPSDIHTILNGGSISQIQNPRFRLANIIDAGGTKKEEFSTSSLGQKVEHHFAKLVANKHKIPASEKLNANQLALKSSKTSDPNIVVPDIAHIITETEVKEEASLVTPSVNSHSSITENKKHEPTTTSTTFEDPIDAEAIKVSITPFTADNQDSTTVDSIKSVPDHIIVTISKPEDETSDPNLNVSKENLDPNSSRGSQILVNGEENITDDALQTQQSQSNQSEVEQTGGKTSDTLQNLHGSIEPIKTLLNEQERVQDLDTLSNLPSPLSVFIEDDTSISPTAKSIIAKLQADEENIIPIEFPHENQDDLEIAPTSASSDKKSRSFENFSKSTESALRHNVNLNREITPDIFSLNGEETINSVPLKESYIKINFGDEKALPLVFIRLSPKKEN